MGRGGGHLTQVGAMVCTKGPERSGSFWGTMAPSGRGVWELGVGVAWSPAGEGASNVKQSLWAFIVRAVGSNCGMQSREAVFRSLGKGGGDFRMQRKAGVRAGQAGADGP